MPSAAAKSPMEIQAASRAGWSSRSSRPRACRRRPRRCTKLGWRTGKSAATSAGRECLSLIHI
eukprot:13728221-Alexandrium_andersonii.AAC.1